LRLLNIIRREADAPIVEEAVETWTALERVVDPCAAGAWRESLACSSTSDTRRMIW